MADNLFQPSLRTCLMSLHIIPDWIHDVKTRALWGQTVCSVLVSEDSCLWLALCLCSLELCTMTDKNLTFWSSIYICTLSSCPWQTLVNTEVSLSHRQCAKWRGDRKWGWKWLVFTFPVTKSKLSVVTSYYWQHIIVMYWNQNKSSCNSPERLENRATSVKTHCHTLKHSSVIFHSETPFTATGSVFVVDNFSVSFTLQKVIKIGSLLL